MYHNRMSSETTATETRSHYKRAPSRLYVLQKSEREKQNTEIESHEYRFQCLYIIGHCDCVDRLRVPSSRGSAACRRRGCSLPDLSTKSDLCRAQLALPDIRIRSPYTYTFGTPSICPSASENALGRSIKFLAASAKSFVLSCAFAEDLQRRSRLQRNVCAGISHARG